MRVFLLSDRKANLVGFDTNIFMLFFYIVGSALALGIALLLWDLHYISLGAAYVLFAYTNTLSTPLNAISDEMQDLQQAEACIQRVETLLNLPSALPDTGTATLPTGPLSVELCQVIFGYEEHEPVIKKLSLELAAGRVLGLLGRTGSGKTTLARLLFRLYDPQSGQILLNGQPLPEIGLHELRRHIGMVTQDVQIFHATVRENLTFFATDIPDELILGYLEDLGLGPWYRGLPEGLTTMLGSGKGERGLSTGEAQLLACARVFLQDPGLVILDEASSRLDPATEALISRAIDRLLSNRTAIIIAHRLSTLQRVDDILLLEHGEMREYGEREALANDPESRFAQLLQSEMQEVLV
jgi:ABC-type multidrug transport system fused ATPase/permease subunit